MPELGRRLDRSIDKRSVLGNPDRALVGQLRNAVETMHYKVESLRDGIDERWVYSLIKSLATRVTPGVDRRFKIVSRSHDQ